MKTETKQTLNKVWFFVYTPMLFLAGWMWGYEGSLPIWVWGGLGISVIFGYIGITPTE
jgi:hypothetical protein